MSKLRGGFEPPDAPARSSLFVARVIAARCAEPGVEVGAAEPAMPGGAVCASKFLLGLDGQRFLVTVSEIPRATRYALGAIDHCWHHNAPDAKGDWPCVWTCCRCSQSFRGRAWVVPDDAGCVPPSG